MTPAKQAAKKRTGQSQQVEYSLRLTPAQARYFRAHKLDQVFGVDPDRTIQLTKADLKWIVFELRLNAATRRAILAKTLKLLMGTA